jgi:hypothetical protein
MTLPSNEESFVGGGVAPSVSVEVPPVAPESPAAASVDVPTPDTSGVSPLMSLRARRDQIQKELYLDVKVPRWDEGGGPSVYIRLSPAAPSFFGKVIEQRKKQRATQPDWMVNANADVLIKHCEGVFLIEEPNLSPKDALPEQMLSLRDGDPSGVWTKIDMDLAAALGLDSSVGTVRTIRALFFTEGDLIQVANKLAEYSGITQGEADEDFFTS